MVEQATIDEEIEGREMRQAFGVVLAQLLREDPRVVVLDNDVDDTTKSDYIRKLFPQQFIEVGIAEKNLFGIAAGLATMGFRPIPTTFAAFAVRCALDQVAISIAFANLDVKIPGHYVGGSRAGASHIPVEDVAVMRSLPNMRVADPADNYDLRAVMRAAMDVNGPVYYRVSKLALPRVFDANHEFHWGQGVHVRRGRDVTFAATGMLTAVALQAAQQLAADGIEAEVLHLASIKPIDTELLVSSARRTGCVVSAENASVIGGLGSAVAEVLGEHEPVPLRRIGYQDRWVHSGSISQILDHHGLRAAHLVAAARDVIDARKR